MPAPEGYEPSVSGGSSHGREDVCPGCGNVSTSWYVFDKVDTNRQEWKLFCYQCYMDWVNKKRGKS